MLYYDNQIAELFSVKTTTIERILYFVEKNS
jgi:hypothetical protein